MQIVLIDCNQISDWETFHEVFKDVMGFPDFYGKNMNAWVDCMTSLDSSEDEMTKFNVKKGEVLTIQLDNVKKFMNQCPEQYAELIESVAFVNWRRIDQGEDPIVTLSFYK